MSLASQLPVLAATIGSAFGGTGAVAARLLAEEAGPAAVSLMRYLGLLAILLAWLALSRMRLPRIQPRDLPALIAVGVLQFGAFGWLFSAGFAYVGAARGAIVLSTMPIQTLILAALLGRERVTLRKLAGMVLGVAGVAIALWSDTAHAAPDAWKGDLLLFAAAFATALNSVMVGPYLARYPVLTVSLVATGVGCVLLAAVAAWAGEFRQIADLSAAGWATTLYFVVGPTFCGFITWTWALSRVAPTRVTVTIVVNPISAAIAGALVLGEGLDPRVALGLVLVAAAIVLVNWPARGPPGER
jgi:drug/metabolite transporter (DMT)-like permease